MCWFAQTGSIQVLTLVDKDLCQFLTSLISRFLHNGHFQLRYRGIQLQLFDYLLSDIHPLTSSVHQNSCFYGRYLCLIVQYSYGGCLHDDFSSIRRQLVRTLSVYLLYKFLRTQAAVVILDLAAMKAWIFNLALFNGVLRQMKHLPFNWYFRDSISGKLLHSSVQYLFSQNAHVCVLPAVFVSPDNKVSLVCPNIGLSFIWKFMLL